MRTAGLHWLTVVLLTSCAPTVLSTRTEKLFVRTDVSQGKGYNHRVNATLEEHRDGLAVRLNSQETCIEKNLRIERHSEITERTGNIAGQVFFYALAVAGVALGTAIVADAPNVPDHDDPNVWNPVTRTGAYIWGVSSLGIGVSSLGVGIGTTLRGLNSENNVREVSTLEGEPREVTCNQMPLAQQSVTVTVEKLPPLKFPPTNREGVASLRWSDLMASVMIEADDPITAPIAAVAGQIFQPEIEATAESVLKKLRTERGRDLALARASTALTEGRLDLVTIQLRIAESFGGDISALKEKYNKARAEDALTAAAAALSSGALEEAARQCGIADLFGAETNQLRQQLEQAQEKAVRALLVDGRKALRQGALHEARAIKDKIRALEGDADAFWREINTEEENRWGPFEKWRKRKENRAVVATISKFLHDPSAVAAAEEAHEKEKESNDDKAREPEAVTTAIFPETSGSFSYIKILNRADSEALFEASDGLFVLRLSYGDSFSAYPGQSVHMTMHSRGETMLMTNGRRLPVFISGSSPVRTRWVPGFKPNRQKERLLEAKAKGLRAGMEKRLATLDDDGYLKSTPPGVSVKVHNYLSYGATGKIGHVTIAESPDDHPVHYCITASANSRCAGAGEEIDGDALIDIK